ncbi:ComF family protein [Microbacterium sp. 3J1]|uniref:ComF family protein n=1 Tax=Microbacterium sp. 3J1 TaxID=861269 RepID=UPI000ACA23B8|nr:phosphoribosyltransferase family protein [Microbacterium sp. 3J1]
MPSSRPFRTIGAELLSFLLAADCAGCGSPETLLCDDCREAIRPRPVDVRTPGGLPVRASLPFESVAARCIRRLKDEGETLLARPLGASLGAVLRDTAGTGTKALAVPVPTSRSSFRRRGYRVPELLLRHAGAEPTRLLSTERGGADQRELGVAQRARNVHGRMWSTRRGRGRPVILVDDIVTTGATLDEAARALDVAGFRVVAAVALAATPRHSERTVNTSETRSK